MENDQKLGRKSTRGAETEVRGNDRALLKLLEADVAYQTRPHGRLICGDPRDVLTLLNTPPAICTRTTPRGPATTLEANTKKEN